MKYKLKHYLSRDYILKYIKPQFKFEGTFVLQDIQKAFIGNTIYDVSIGYITNDKGTAYVWCPGSLIRYNRRKVSAFLERRAMHNCFRVDGEYSKRYGLAEQMKADEDNAQLKHQKRGLELLITSPN